MVQQTKDQHSAQRGIPAACPVATPEGWRMAAALGAGDSVWCLDGPPQPILRVRRMDRPPRWVVQVPAAALGNPDPVDLPAGQPVALDLDQAALLYGDPVALIPVAALVGWRGIRRCRARPGQVVQLEFVRRQVIYAGPGLLLGCEADAPPLLCPGGPPAPPLTEGQAAHLMACVMAQEVGEALRYQAALAAAKRA